MTPEQIERYQRHILVKEIGGPGQKKLLDAHVLIIGAGALGGVAARILAASGVGKLTVYDPDRVELSNLQRQTQFSAKDIAATKAGALMRSLSLLNSDVRVEPIQQRWTSEDGLHDADLVLDGSDNFETRFALNVMTQKAGIPLVTGAVAGWTGQVMAVNNPADDNSPCYQCFVPSEPPQAGDCNDLGVVGAISHMVASQQALLAMRYLIGARDHLFGQLTLIEGLSGVTRTIALPKDPACPTCQHEMAVSDGL